MNLIIWIGFALMAATAAVAGLAVLGASRWASRTRALLVLLERNRVALAPAHYDVREIDGLPAPVKRYFRFVLQDGQPVIAAATVEHVGSFNLSSAGERWKPFTSTQRVITRKPGFVWNARIAMAPGLAVFVHDAYVDGQGILNPSVLGLFSLAAQIDAADLAHGELARFFAEMAWYPTALLPSQGVRWVAVDEHCAMATLVDGQVSVTMLVRFNQPGLIESVRVEARAALVGKTIVHLPWEGRWSNYQKIDGMFVPFTAEVAWLWPAGRRPYWRGTITAIGYEYIGAK